jgi:hypothetical protein
VYYAPMFSRRLKLHEHGGSILITIPADVVRKFRLVKGNQLDMTYKDAKLIIDLPNPTNSPQLTPACEAAA